MVIKIYQREPTSQIFFSCGALRKINYRNDKNDAYIVIIENFNFNWSWKLKL